MTASRKRPPNAGKGRRKGVPNKVTRDVRQAIAAFAEANVEKLQEWIDATAKTDPARAAELFVRVLEYHIPKLARTQVAGDSEQPLTVELVRFAMSDAELESIARRGRSGGSS